MPERPTVVSQWHMGILYQNHYRRYPFRKTLRLSFHQYPFFFYYTNTRSIFSQYVEQETNGYLNKFFIFNTAGQWSMRTLDRPFWNFWWHEKVMILKIKISMNTTSSNPLAVSPCPSPRFGNSSPVVLWQDQASHLHCLRVFVLQEHLYKVLSLVNN